MLLRVEHRVVKGSYWACANKGEIENETKTIILQIRTDNLHPIRRRAEIGKALVVTGRGGSNIFLTICSQMEVRLSALRIGRPLPPGRFLALISVRGLTNINYSVLEISWSVLSMHKEKRNAYRILVGKLEGRGPLGGA
jgi:hypothetical protein